MKKLIISLMLILSVNAHALSEKQMDNLQIAYSIGKITKANDGMTFEKTLASIMLTESSAGKNLVGDDRYKNGTKKPLYKSSLGTMQMQISTARWLSKKYDALQWVQRLNDKQLTAQILNNSKFACILAGYYILYNYELAQRKGMWNPYYKTISRYNGGWKNETYFRRVMKNMKLVNKLIKEGKLK